MPICSQCQCTMKFDEVSQYDESICIDCEPEGLQYIEPEKRKIMKYEINTEIVFSTCHITEDDSDYLRNIDDDRYKTEVVGERFEYGYRILVSGDNCKAHELSPEFYELMDLARKLSCKWLVLDRDGQEFSEFEKFNW